MPNHYTAVQDFTLTGQHTTPRRWQYPVGGWQRPAQPTTSTNLHDFAAAQQAIRPLLEDGPHDFVLGQEGLQLGDVLVGWATRSDTGWSFIPETAFAWKRVTTPDDLTWAVTDSLRPILYVRSMRETG